MNLHFPTGSELLGGTLALPGGTGPFPGALIINGSGPIDRDSNMPGQDLNIAKELASALADGGVASLRYDKRGVGDSSGNYLATGFFEEVEDTHAALDALSRHPAIDETRVIAVGHSVGAAIAGRLAAARGVAGCILLSATAEDGATVMRQQSASIAATMTGLGRWRRRSFLRSQDTLRLRLEQSEGDILEGEGTVLPARWFREYMSYDPRSDLARINQPVLAVTGAHDVQVNPEDVHVIAGVVKGPSTAWIAPGITHLLRTGRPGLSHYQRTMSDPVDDELLRMVVGWCQRVVTVS